MAEQRRHRELPRRMSPLAAVIVAVLVIALVVMLLSLIHGSWYPGTW